TGAASRLGPAGAEPREPAAHGKAERSGEPGAGDPCAELRPKPGLTRSGGSVRFLSDRSFIAPEGHRRPAGRLSSAAVLERSLNNMHLAAGGKEARMRAIVITRPGGPEVLQIQEVPDPVPGEGEVLIRGRAFGVNHAETHMRKGEWPEATPISGIEAVGTVVTDPSGALAEGTRVLTIMGGLGRTRNGSYAEYTVAPAANVATVETALDWAD